MKCFVNALLVVMLNAGMVAFYINRQSAAGTMIMVGSVAAVFQYLNLLMDAFGFYSGDYENIIHWWQDYCAAAEIFDGTDDHRNKTSLIDHDLQPPRDWHTIETVRLEFSYGGGQARLHCGPIRLEKGKRIAFIGESGAGKSTCLNILGGLLSADATFTVDGKTGYPIGYLGRIATLIGQQPEIFENTLLYNITLGLPASAGELEHAARIACFDEVVSRLPNGYATDIREDGVNLSGGEKQRLALARGFFAIQDSSLLLLDEPTGSLDVTTESNVYRRLFKAFPDMCIVSTLHKLHLLPMFDTIYVFENGCIAESGSLDELLSAGGLLSKLWNNIEADVTAH